MPERRCIDVAGPADLAAHTLRLLEDGHRLALVAAHHEPSALRVVYLFTAWPDRRTELILRADPASPHVPSLAALSFPASRFEREMRNMYGVEPDNHPMPRPASGTSTKESKSLLKDVRSGKSPHWPNGSRAARQSDTRSPTASPSKPPSTSPSRRRRSECAPRCWNWNACTTTWPPSTPARSATSRGPAASATMRASPTPSTISAAHRAHLHHRRRPGPIPRPGR